MTAKAIQRGAELGLSFACNLGRHQVEIYRSELRRLGKDPAAFNIVNSRIVYVADSAEQAWADIEPAAMYQASLYGKWLSAANPGQRWIQPDADQLRQSSILGSSETVRQRLAEVIATSGATELILITQLPGLAPEKAMRSVERFASEVMPHLLS
jgi:alkanesulfonate monooxygenase SsuD/methylene tetrahydromethanopterin reductase-like flavin-dependent oxidoreductase (luciferase family)